MFELAHHIKLIFIMYAFAYWHTYYDSAFTVHPFKIPNILYSDLQISSQLAKWPSNRALPQLPKLFDVLQTTILTEENWVGCIQSQKEMEELESEINVIVVNLQCEKRYGQQFWEKHPRRVQSSIVHFYLYFKTFITTLIPEQCDTLMEASLKEKLAFSLKKLEQLVNNILPNLKYLHRFLFQPYFSEEQKIIKQFLQDFLQLLYILPNISKQKLTKTPKLMEFICIINPLETQITQQSQSSSSIRRKNATADPYKKTKEKGHSEQKSSKKSQSEVSVKNIGLSKSKNRKGSLDQIKVNFSPPKDITKKIQIFKLKQKVRKYSLYRTAKKHTISSYDTKQKTGSIEKERSPSNQRSLSFMEHYQMKRTETLPAGRRKQQSFYVQKRPREDSSKTIREKSQSRGLLYDREEVQHQRQMKMKKKKGTKIAIKTVSVSKQHNLGSGKSRGWGFVRQWFAERLANRKLKALFKQF